MPDPRDEPDAPLASDVAELTDATPADDRTPTTTEAGATSADHAGVAEGDHEADAAAERPVPTRREIARALLRPSRGQFAVAVLCLCLGFGSVLQIQAHRGSQTYAGARRDDLVSMLDSLDKEKQRLNTEEGQLEQQKSELQSGADKQKVATDAANKRVETLGILAGTLPAQGPGVRLVIGDPQHKITPAMVLDAIEELRDSGAEAIELNDNVRVVASTAFTQGPDGILADGRILTFPLQIDAIGDPATLEGGARFRGGIVSQVQAPTVGGSALITQLDNVEVKATVPVKPTSYAKPAK